LNILIYSFRNIVLTLAAGVEECTGRV